MEKDRENIYNKWNELETLLLDVDGSCRDITFSDIEPENASALLELFNSLFEFIYSNEADKDNLSYIDTQEHLKRANKGILHTTWQSKWLISHIQLFISWENRNFFFAEITFFPDNVIKESYSFIAFLRLLAKLTKAEHFYVRYENASWGFGDTSQTSGVIFTDKEFNEWSNRIGEGEDSKTESADE